MSRELDLLVADRITLWSYRKHRNMEDPHCDCVPRYSEDFGAAMYILAKWRGDFEIRRQNGWWRATFFEPSREYEALAQGPAEAICLAALKAWEHTEEEVANR